MSENPLAASLAFDFAEASQILQAATQTCSQLEAMKSELVQAKLDFKLEKESFEQERCEWYATAKAEMEAEKLSLVELKNKIDAEQAALSKLCGAPSDLFTLNFGGERLVTVKRSLLVQLEGSLLATMFSGRHDERLDRDKDGNVFFDYSPSVMMPLIEYLRLYRDTEESLREALPLPDIEPAFSKAWKSMCDFMNLEIDDNPAALHGIQIDLDMSQLHGWHLLSATTYDHATTMQDFVLPSALKGGALLLGAREVGSNTLLVAAMGDYEVITRERDDPSTILHNGVHWYCYRGKSIGFAPSSQVLLKSADTHDPGDARRLSWHLGQTQGGWRAGSITVADTESTMEKIIMVSKKPLVFQ